MELDGNGLARLCRTFFRYQAAIAVLDFIRNLSCTDHLIDGLAVFFHIDDVGTGGKTGDRDSTVGSSFHTVGGEAAKGHGAANLGTVDGDSAALLRLEAIGSAGIPNIEQNVMFCVDDLLAAAVGFLVDGHIGCDGGILCVHRHDNDTGILRPDGGPLLAAFAVIVINSIIADQNDGGAGLLCLDLGIAAIVGIRRNTYHIRSTAIGRDDFILHIGQRQAVIGDGVTKGQEVTEHIQIPDVTGI